MFFFLQNAREIDAMTDLTFERYLVDMGDRETQSILMYCTLIDTTFENQLNVNRNSFMGWVE